MAFEKIPSQRVLEVKVEKSLDLLAKRWDESVFIKLYASMRTSGLLARLSDSNFRTLVALATFMNAEGQCYPSQNALAVALGVTQPAVAKRLKRLAAFRWQDRPLVTTHKVRRKDGKYENTVYTVLAETGLDIFNKKARTGHITPSHMAEGHANKSQTENKILDTVTGRRIFTEGDREARELAQDLDDLASLAYYRKVIREVPAPIWCRARGEALEERNIRKSRGALFAHLVKKHTGGLGNRSPARSIKHKSHGLDD